MANKLEAKDEMVAEDVLEDVNFFRNCRASDFFVDLADNFLLIPFSSSYQR
jgi:hypothetical protein